MTDDTGTTLVNCDTIIARAKYAEACIAKLAAERAAEVMRQIQSMDEPDPKGAEVLIKKGICTAAREVRKSVLKEAADLAEYEGDISTARRIRILAEKGM